MRQLSDDELKSVRPAETAAFPGPIPTQSVSSDEFMPAPQTQKQQRVEARIKEMGNVLARRQGLSRRQFLATASGMAAAFDFSGLSIERYYHFHCISDSAFLQVLDELGHSATDVCADISHHEAERATHERGREADEERGPGAVDDPREDVASERIGPEQVLERRPLEEIGEVERGRVIWGDPVRQRRRKEHDDDQHRPRRAEGTPPDELTPEPREPARPGRLEVAAPRDVVRNAHRRLRHLRHE